MHPKVCVYVCWDGWWDGRSGLESYTKLNTICTAIFLEIQDCERGGHIIFCVINSTDDCILLQTDTEHIKGWCTANFIKLNSTTTVVIIFTRKTNVLYYKLWDSSNTRTDTTLGYNLNWNFISAHTQAIFSPNS